jgi:hypothetical protein
LESFYGGPLGSMVVGIFAENADVVEVLVAVGWRWVLVSAELVASTGDAGVEKTGLSGVVVAELGRAAVTPWVAFHVSGLWVLCMWTRGE